MPTLSIGNKSIQLDDSGHLKEFDQWSDDVARELARQEGIEDLNDEHLEVLEIMRDYYRQFKVAPMIHLLAKECGKTYRQLHTLFKKQPGKRAAKLAGLPKATGCT